MGDLFAWDGVGYDGGDVHFCEVLEVRPTGYRVLSYANAHANPGEPVSVEDFYDFDFCNGDMVRLTREQMDQARQAGWPCELAFLCRLVGWPDPDELDPSNLPF